MLFFVIMGCYCLLLIEIHCLFMFAFVKLYSDEPLYKAKQIKNSVQNSHINKFFYGTV